MTKKNDKPEIAVLSRQPELTMLMAAVGSGQRQSMAGFDDEFTDIVDYILRITHRIWEEGGVGRIYDYYGHMCPVETAYGTSYTCEEVVQGTLATLAAYPDRRLYGEEIIWSGDDVQGFHTSHRILNTATNTGYSRYGPPTGKRAVWRGIANCFMRENRIVEEWLVRDEMSLILQLGYNPRTLAEKLIHEEAYGVGLPADPQSEVARGVGQLPPERYPERGSEKESKEFDIEDFIRRTYHELWNWRLLNTLKEEYAESFRCHAPAGREFNGLDSYKVYLLSIMGMFPDLKMSVEHVYWLEDTGGGFRVATRWRLSGTHSGPGIYGSPTGARVSILGITQHVVQNKKIVEEWMVFDEFALLKEIVRKQLNGGDRFGFTSAKCSV